MDATGSQELEGAKMELYIYDDNNKRGSEPLVRWTSGKTPYVITSDKYPQLVRNEVCVGRNSSTGWLHNYKGR